MNKAPRSILVLADLRKNNANTIHDHVTSFGKYSRHDVYYFDPMGRYDCPFLDLNEFDVVVNHYSLYALCDAYLHPLFKQKLARYRGLKMAFIQDDYRSINRMCDQLRIMGTNVLYTLYPADRMHKVWTPDRLPGVRIISNLAGYVPEYLENLSVPRIADRTIDVGYRSRACPYWLGELSQDKKRISDLFSMRARATDLAVDISVREADRIYGADWPKFIMNCKATLGTESGASVTDFDDSAERRTRAYLAKHPRATYEETYAAILHQYEDNVRLNCISPRQFEAAALRSTLVLFPGEYSNILEPWVHYIPLEKDFSNFDQVVEKIKDHDLLEAMAERAHQDLIQSGKYSFRTFISEFDEVVDEMAACKSKTWMVNYRAACLHRIASEGFSKTQPIRNRSSGWLKLVMFIPMLIAELTHLLLIKPVRPIRRLMQVTPFLVGLARRKWVRQTLRRLCGKDLFKVSLKRLTKEMLLLKNLIGRILHPQAGTGDIPDFHFHATLDNEERLLRFECTAEEPDRPVTPRLRELLRNFGDALATGEIRAIEFATCEPSRRHGLGGWRDAGWNLTISVGESPVFRFSALESLFQPNTAVPEPIVVLTHAVINREVPAETHENAMSTRDAA